MVKRCVVSGRFMMWSDVQISVGKDGMTQREKKRWNKCINLFLVTDISPLNGKKSKKSRKFKITVQDRHHHRHHHQHHGKKKGHKKKRKLFVRDYVFRAKSKKWRDKWVDGLRDHIEHIQRERTFMKQSESKYNHLHPK